MEDVIKNSSVQRIIAEMARKSILGEVVILNESARSAAEAAAGHPHAVFPTIYSELLRSTRARPLKVGD